MSKFRRAARIDSNQPKIVKELLSFPGMSVEVGYDDIIVGYKGVTLWVEVKTEECLSKKTGIIKESAKKPSQKTLDKTFTGARIYCTKADDVFEWFGIEIND